MTKYTRKELVTKIERYLETMPPNYKLPCDTESKFQDRLISILKKIFGREIWFSKISDRYTSGIPDILGCLDGKMFAFELKDDKGKASLLQENTIDKIRKAGGTAWVIRTVEEALKILLTILRT